MFLTPKSMFLRTVTEQWNVYEWSDLTKEEKKRYYNEVSSYIESRNEENLFENKTRSEVVEDIYDYMCDFWTDVVLEEDDPRIHWEVEKDDVIPTINSVVMIKEMTKRTKKIIKASGKGPIRGCCPRLSNHSGKSPIERFSKSTRASPRKLINPASVTIKEVNPT